MTLQRLGFELRGDHIPLDALLKATGLAPSGGAAKRMVADGRVQVDGRDEARKTCKIRAGQVVSVAGARILVQAAGSAPVRAEGDGDGDALRGDGSPGVPADAPAGADGA